MDYATPSIVVTTTEECAVSTLSYRWCCNCVTMYVRECRGVEERLVTDTSERAWKIDILEPVATGEH